MIFIIKMVSPTGLEPAYIHLHAKNLGNSADTKTKNKNCKLLKKNDL